jgi:3',5'-cyclic AMP phosphodiesterase CpdA
LRLGVLTDLHHGLDPRAMERLEAFLTAAEAAGVDAVAQLGDFNYADAAAQECLALWRQAPGERLDVLGNHDMDKATKEQAVAASEMPGRYHSRDLGGWHVVVLDRNNLRTDQGYVGYSESNYYVDPELRGHADPEQLEWLAADLAATSLPTLVLVHQGLGVQDRDAPGAAARGPIEATLAAARRPDGSPKVAAVLCGHHHADRFRRVDGIHYVWINSASYYWVGAQYGRMAAYADPLFAFLTLHPDGAIEIRGRSTTWEPPSPAERGYPGADELATWISDRTLAAPRAT